MPATAITYAVAGIMQFTLLSICLAWKMRQRRLGVDDFGVALAAAEPQSSVNSAVPDRFRDSEQGPEDEDDDNRGVPGMVVGEEEDASAVHKALVSALGEAVAADVRTGVETATEQTPLLGGDAATATKGKGRAGWW
jgi:hypothetical protein